MSGVLHPTGPEPARTYWVRRGILLGVVLLLVVGVVLAVANLTRAAVATAPPPPLPAGGPASSPSPGTSGAGTPTSQPSSSPSSTPLPTSPRPTTPSGSTSAAPSTRSSTPPSAAPSTSASPAVTVIGTPDCRPADLRVSLKGDERLSVGENTVFTVTVTNTGRLTCLTSVSSANFALAIVSGDDRIWNSRDCRTTLAPFDKKLAVKGVHAWRIAWNGERSVQGENCRKGPDPLRAGTYRATAQLRGTDPARLRMIIS